MEVKVCTRCGETKVVTDFRPRKNRPTPWTSECRACLTARDSRRYHADREAANGKSLEYRKAHRAELAARQRARYAADAEAHRAAARARYAANPEPYKDRAITRFHQLAGGRVRRAYIAERDGWRCHICGGKVTRKTMSIDHLVPLSRGGEHSEQNVRLAHLSCNIKRGADRMPAQLLLIA